MTRKIIVFLLSVQSVFAIDLTGIWKSVGPGGQVALTLRQEGNRLSGSEDIGGHVLPISGGSVSDDKISFSVSLPIGGRLRPLPMTALVREGELVLHGAGFDFVLRRDVPDGGQIRIQRIASAMRLWGTIRFFHPYLAHRPIDWNGALISALPLVEKAQNNDEFSRAISSMLRVLDDPETRALGEGEPDPASSDCRCRSIVRSGFFDSRAALSSPYYADWEAVARNAPYVVRLPELRVAVRVAEPTSGDSGFQSLQEVDRSDLPSKEQRLLALALYWNAVHYFDGYPELLESWDSALEDFIPRFEGAQTRKDYVSAVIGLASRTHDGHAGLGSLWPITVLGLQPDVVLRHAGDQVVVTASNVSGIERGDVIEAVDGKPVAEVEKQSMGLFAWSTYRFGVYNADRFLLSGSASSVRVGVRKSDGQVASIELARTTQLATLRSAPVLPTSFGRLPSGFGYIDLTRISEAQVDTAFDSMMDAPGIIFDLRDAAVHGVFQQVAARLADKPAVVTRIRLRVWHGPDPAAMTEENSSQIASPMGKGAYRGPIAVLINASAFSQTEHTGLFLEGAAAKTIFVGSPTSGTDGELTGVLLPGHLQANFSGEAILHGNGRELQRIGIIPDVWVEPTVGGIRDGRDEVLEAAIRALQREAER